MRNLVGVATDGALFGSNSALPVASGTINVRASTLTPERLWVYPRWDHDFSHVRVLILHKR